jgi:predicted RNA-binding protein Jag
MNVHEFEGKNEEEAISKAIEALGLDREEIDVEIVEAKKAAFLFGGGKVRIRVHLDEDRQSGESWGSGAQPEAQRLRDFLEDEDSDRQPADYRHPDAWKQPSSRSVSSGPSRSVGSDPGRGQRQRGERRQDARPSERRSRRGSPKSGSRRSPVDRYGYERYGYERNGYDRRAPDTAIAPRNVFLEPENDFEQKILEFLKGLFQHIGIEAEIRIAFREDRKLGLDVDSPDSGILIGKRGQTLEAIQTLTNVVASRMKNGNVRVIVDSQNYRLRRERSLVRIAQQTADEVRRTRQSRLLEAMNPFERRLIHTTLSEEADIETASEGEGLYKRVRILYRGPQNP